MPRFELLGGFHFSNQQVGEFRLSGKKSEALLIYLLMQQGVPQSRVHISTLLWSRSASEQALGSLRQECLKLKKVLHSFGIGLELDNRYIGLVTDSYSLDVSEFEECMSQGDTASLSRAYDLFKGDFLEGRPLPDPAYTAWFQRQRERLGQLALSGFQVLAEAEFALGNAAKTENIARTMLRIDPTSERPIFWLMQSLGQQSKVVAAAETYIQYAKKLKLQYGISPGQEITSLYEKLATNRQSLKSSHGHTVDTTQSEESFPTVAVIPFDLYGSTTDSSGIADGLSRDLSVALGRFRNFSVMAFASTRQLKANDTSHENWWKTYRIRYVIEGTIRIVAERMRVTVELIDTSNGTQVWSEKYDRTIEDVFDLQDEITQTVTNGIDRKILQKRHYHLTQEPTTNMSAYDLMVKAWLNLEAFNQEQNKLAIELCQSALEIDNQYSQVYALLSFGRLVSAQNGWTENVSDTFKLAHKNGVTAVNLDARNHLAHTALGITSLFLHDHRRSLSSLPRAVQLNPGSADSKAFLSIALSYCGQPEEALKMLDEAVVANPLHPYWYKHFAARAHYILGQYQQSIELLEDMDALSPDYTTGLMLKAAAFAALNNIPDAGKQVQLIKHSSPNIRLKDVSIMAPYQSQKDLDRYIADLETAGF